MSKTRVFTDKLQHMASEFEEIGLGIENLEPVDINGGFVAVDKQSPDNLRRTQKNIQWKTSLAPMGGDGVRIQPFETPKDRYVGITQAKVVKGGE
jgi:hypothetical protein